MKVNSIFSSFLAVDSINITNKDQLIAWAKKEVNFNGTKNYKGTNSNHLDKNDLVLKELIDKIEIGFNTLHTQMDLKNTIKQKVSSVWVNDGSMNNAIETPHRHVEGIFSAVYWPVADVGCAPLTFINPNNQMSYVFKSNMIEHMNEFNSDQVSIQPQINQCVFFPSWLWHYVSHALSKTNNRMSFAFNSEAVSK